MAKILCIEDELELRSDICDELRDSGYEVLEAANGADGLDIIRSEEPDLVLCDIRMPVMDGYELLANVRSGCGRWATVPFIFLTAFGERADILNGLEKGADDYLTKPIDYDLLLSRVATIIRQVNRMTEQVKSSQRDLQKELNRAHSMQKDLLPCKETVHQIEDMFDLRLSSHYEPSTELGGDIWGAQMISHNKIMLYLVDFSGHGIAAAMNTFRLHSKIESEPLTDQDPAAYLGDLNLWLCDHMQTGQYATVLLGVLDCDQQVFSYSAGGSPSPIRLKGDDKTIEVGSGKGVPLGLSKTAKYENRVLDMKKGDGLFLYSDALIEHGRQDNRDLGRAGVEKLVLDAFQNNGHVDAREILLPFLTAASRPLSDDLSVVCCFRRD